ncbi:MAG: ABC transporter permease subunit [Acidimicrobiia bacterium]|nr:ABC transporter permease subunit [Acidimicrobiia bacterium]
MRLLGIELRRMWHRRMPRVIVGLGIVGVLVGGGAAFFTHDATMPVVEDHSAEIEASVAECRQYSTQDWERWASGDTTDINPDYGQYLSQFQDAEAYADENCRPEYFSYFDVLDPRFCLVTLYEPEVQWRRACPDIEDAATEYEPSGRIIVINGVEYQRPKPMGRGTVPEMGYLLFAIAAVIGASFIGAEYKAGTVESTLLWEPRRIAVFGSKLAAAALTTLVIQIFLLAVLVLAMLPAALWRGTTAGADADFWVGLVGVILRSGVVGAAIAMIALSVSTVTRNTVGGVAVLLGYTAVSPILSQVIFKGLRPIDLSENAAVLANGGEVGRFIRNGVGYDIVVAHGVLGAALVVGVYVAIAVLIAGVVFARRDVD